MNDLTALLDAIEARAAAATKGPWWWGTPGEDETATAAESLLSMLHDPSAHCSTVWAAWTARDGETVLPAVTGDGPTSRSNAEFIAHAREDVPALLAEVRRLQAVVERVAALAEDWRYKGEHGWDDGSHAYGPSPEGELLDNASHDLFRALDAAALGIEGAS